MGAALMARKIDFEAHAEFGQALVTCLLTDQDKERAATMMLVAIDDGTIDHTVLSLVLVELAAYVHEHWCDATGITSTDEILKLWQLALLDATEWRTRR